MQQKHWLKCVPLNVDGRGHCMLKRGVWLIINNPMQLKDQGSDTIWACWAADF